MITDTPLPMYRPLKFHFCRSPSMSLGYSLMAYDAMDIVSITKDQVSTNHEFHDEFEELFQDHDQLWVPSTFPAITSWTDVLRAQLVHNLHLQNKAFSVETTPMRVRVFIKEGTWTKYRGGDYEFFPKITLSLESLKSVLVTN
jgi:hypothetical protein